MNPVILIDKKRLGHPLLDDEIRFLIDGFTTGTIPDYQLSALAMAICWRGMDIRETLSLTRAMLESGATLEWESGPPVVDKHSTGGVGDKSSLILAPLLACCGVRVPMISGRGLGATGGTLDKLESIPGFRTNLPILEMQKLVNRLGCAMIGQTEEICPADRKLYALRDATATVASIPLITASILSKKIAEGLDALVLDVKFGSGAFMKTREEAERLSESMQHVLDAFGLPGHAHLNPMNQPTGRMVGNAVEVIESIDVLKGGGPDDLKNLVYKLASTLLTSVKIAQKTSHAKKLLDEEINSGRAFAKLEEMVAAQGGRIDQPLSVAPATEFLADRSGTFSKLDAGLVGYALIALGGGRMKTTDTIDHSVGFEFRKVIGDELRAGEPILRIFAHSRGKEQARDMLRKAITISAD